MCDPTTCTRDCVPRVTPGTDPRSARLCVCDPDADRLAALMAEGYDQWTASLMLWAPAGLSACSWALRGDKRSHTATQRTPA